MITFGDLRMLVERAFDIVTYPFINVQDMRFSLFNIFMFFAIIKVTMYFYNLYVNVRSGRGGSNG